MPAPWPKPRPENSIDPRESVMVQSEDLIDVARSRAALIAVRSSSAPTVTSPLGVVSVNATVRPAAFRRAGATALIDSIAATSGRQLLRPHARSRSATFDAGIAAVHVATFVRSQHALRAAPSPVAIGAIAWCGLSVIAPRAVAGRPPHALE